ncbi:hypothetical protein OHA25_13805 [Nonomuraea sp. NBC_00507]|uniref:hypothetical protein n=1 Tax=Nonomuraea sp. NBC_00507 TaxID=2976002 RepID=UPI002E173583
MSRRRISAAAVAPATVTMTPGRATMAAHDSAGTPQPSGTRRPCEVDHGANAISGSRAASMIQIARPMTYNASTSRRG